MPILTKDDYKKILDTFNIQTQQVGTAGDVIIVPTECGLEGNEKLLAEQEKMGDNIKSYILEKHGLSQESLYNLEIFEYISNTVTFE